MSRRRLRHKYMKHILFTLILVFSFTVFAFGQTEPSKTIPAANDDDPLAAMLRQSIEEARAYKAEAAAYLIELKARERLSAIDEKLIARYEKIIAAADILIARLEKQCSTTSLFWGLLKFKKC